MHSIPVWGYDAGLKGVLDSLMAYTRGEKEEGPFDKFFDNEEIIDACSSICRKEIAEMVASLCSLHVKDKEVTDMVLLLARLYQALLPPLPALCSVSGGIRRMTAPTLQRYHNIISG